MAVVEPASEDAEIPPGTDRYGRRPDPVTTNEVRRPAGLNDITTDGATENPTILWERANQTHAPKFTVLLDEMFNDAGLVVPRVKAGASVDTSAGASVDSDGSRSGGTLGGDIPVHAVTLVQPDGDIVTRIDEDSLVRHPAEIEAHTADVRHFVAGYQDAIRRRVLLFQFFAVFVIVGVPQVWSGWVSQDDGTPWRLVAPAAVMIIAFGEILTDRLLGRQWDHPAYRWFRNWRDSKWHGWTISGLSALAAVLAVGGNPFDEFDLADYGVLLRILCGVLLVVAVVAVISRLTLRHLRQRFLT